MPKTVDDLRRKDDQKVTYNQPIIMGSAEVKNGSVFSDKTMRFRENDLVDKKSLERSMITSVDFKKSKVKSKITIKDNQKKNTVEYFGAAKHDVNKHISEKMKSKKGPVKKQQLDSSDNSSRNIKTGVSKQKNMNKDTICLKEQKIKSDSTVPGNISLVDSKKSILHNKQKPKTTKKECILQDFRNGNLSTEINKGKLIKKDEFMKKTHRETDVKTTIEVLVLIRKIILKIIMI